MKPLTDYEVEQIIRTVAYRLYQLRNEGITDFPDGITAIMDNGNDSFLSKHCEIQSQEVTGGYIIGTLKFINLTKPVILKIDMDILKKGTERSYNNNVNKVIDFFNNFVKSYKQVESESV